MLILIAVLYNSIFIPLFALMLCKIKNPGKLDLFNMVTLFVFYVWTNYILIEMLLKGK